MAPHRDLLVTPAPCHLVIGATTLLLLIAAAPAQTDLWGRNGEKWTPQSNLPDFSFAGYQHGEKAIPNLPRGVSIKTFGAKGDGVADDSQAFLDAVAKAQGAIEIPPGKYKITQIIEVKRAGVVLRGAGPDKTILLFPTVLNDIKPDWGATTTGQRTSNYSWGGGFIWFKGDTRSKNLAKVTADAKRGDKALSVDKPDAFSAGQRILIYQQDNADNSLGDHLYSGDAGSMTQLRGRTRMQLIARVVRVAGNVVHFDRPLRCDVKGQWQPAIRAFEPSVSESGVENLAFEFPETPYKGHFTELGYNAVAMSGCSDCWVRNVRIVNSDSGIYLNGFHCMATGIVIESTRKPDRSGSTGHHGLTCYGHDNVITNFDIRTQFIHDLTVDGGASGNVFSNGKAEDLCLDHHKRTCYENCFTNLDAGAGTHLWRHGGGADLGKPCAARGTFWNITARKALGPPPKAFGPPTMNVVGVGGAAVLPANIHEAQVGRRVGAKK